MDPTIDVSEFKSLCNAGAIKRMVIGSIFIYGVPTNPKLARQYFLTNRQIMQDSELVQMASSNNIDYKTPLVNETVVLSTVGVLGYCFLFYYIFKKLNNPMSTNFKTNGDLS